MSTAELDPLFFKGLRLLHSKSRDSADQLKQLLDDAIAQSKQSSNYKSYASGKLDIDSKLHLKKSSSRESSEVGTLNLKLNIEETRERKLEKRQFEKVKQDSTENLHDAKIPKLESPQVFSSVHFSNLLQYPPSPDLPKLDQYVPRKDEDSDSSEENADADDFAMEMGLACVICKQIDVSHGNQLIECQECHSLYHQECHRPPATDYDVNDPRRVWYCAKCMKNMKKMATKTQKTTKSAVPTVAKEPVAQTKFSKTETSPPALILPFKRSELKVPISQSNTQSSANKPIGLAGLAANFSGRVTTASTSSVTAQSSRVINSKASTSSLGPKPFSSFSSASSTNKNTSSTGLSSSLGKTSTSATTFPTLSAISQSSTPSLSTASSAPTLAPKTSVSSSLATATKTAYPSIAAAPVASSSRSAPNSNNGNSGHTSKTASCSPLMSADKRVQIMKKKAAKLQEKRRLSTK